MWSVCHCDNAFDVYFSLLYPLSAGVGLIGSIAYLFISFLNHPIDQGTRQPWEAFSVVPNPQLRAFKFFRVIFTTDHHIFKLFCSELKSSLLYLIHISV